MDSGGLEKRIAVLDVIRGFAVFGILLVNMLSFHSPYLYISFDPFSWWDTPADQALYRVIHVLAEGSFYPLFSLLFGYGLVLLMEKTTARGLNFRTVALRRLTVLLLFGMIHAFLIWHGDILIAYAVMGFIFLLFLRMSGKGMILTGALLASISAVLFSVLMFAAVSFAPEEEWMRELYDQHAAEQTVQAYQAGSFAEISAQRFSDWSMVNNIWNATGYLFMILPYFLLGGGAAKYRWMERIEELKRPFAAAFAVFFAAGLSLKLVPHVVDFNLASQFVAYAMGGPLLAIAYGLGIALLFAGNVGKGLLAFSPVGRMSLTNYIMQSVICALIFYSYGLGLYGKVSVTAGTVIAFVLFGLQMVFSRLWMNRFRYGPLEWLWRTATYMKKQPMKR